MQLHFFAVARFIPFALFISVEGSPGTQEQAATRGGEEVEIVTPYVFDGSLRNMRRAALWSFGDPIKEIPRRSYRRVPDEDSRGRARAAAGPDTLLNIQSRAARGREIRALTTPVRDFEGQVFSGVNPPDTVGDVGPQFYVQMINSSSGSELTIYNKSDGSTAAGPISLDTMGSGECANGHGDPIVLYDAMAERWLLSEFSSAGDRMCVYVSKTSDPVSGGWFNYDFRAPRFPDYPKYGVWPSAYLVSTNEATGPALYALERAQMLTGQPAKMQRFSVPVLDGFGFQALTPADLDGPTAPPSGAPGYFIRHRDDEVHNLSASDPQKDFLELWELSVDFADASRSTVSGPHVVALAEFDSTLCGLSSFDCFPQPGASSQRLDPLREVVMQRLQYRNNGSHQTLVGNFVTDVNGADRGGIRWFELRKQNAGWTLFQEGTFSPDDDNRFMGSIAMDGRGNLAIGYNITSRFTFPGLRYAGREAGDPKGTLTHGEFTLVGGLAANGSSRYGDYSALSVDPDDDCTFWFTGQHNPSDRWATRVGAFSFGSCEGTEHAEFDRDTCLNQCSVDRENCSQNGTLHPHTCVEIFQSCTSFCGEAPSLSTARLTVAVAVTPGADRGVFDLQVDGVSRVANVGNGGSTGPLQLPAGAHTVGVAGGSGTSLEDYGIEIGGDCNADGSILLSGGDEKTCTARVSRTQPTGEPAACASACAANRARCETGPLGASVCRQLFDLCQELCTGQSMP